MEGPGIDNRKFEHVSSDSPEYVDIRRRIQELISEKRGQRKDDFFAEFNLYIIDECFRIIDGLEQLEDGPERDKIDDSLRIIREELDLCKQDLHQMFKIDFDWYANFFRVVAEELYSEGMSKDELDDKAVELGVNFFVNQDSVDYDSFLKMLDSYRDRFKRESEKFQESIPSTKSEFKIRIKKAIEEGMLSIPLDKVDYIIDNIKPRMLDTHKEDSYCKNGSYSSNGELIVYFYPESNTTLSGTLCHEYIHALSGLTIVKMRRGAGKNDKFIDQKMGLSFLGAGGRDIYGWLDEAVTEELNRRIFAHDNRSNIYSLERNALGKMIEDGIPEQLIFDAYFEEYDPNNPDRVPKWKLLSKKIQEVYPEGLAKLKSIGDEIAMEKEKQQEQFLSGDKTEVVAE